MLPIAFRILPLSLMVLVCVINVGCGDLAESLIKGTLQSVAAGSMKQSSDATIRMLFETANESCPKRVDEYTTLESIQMLDQRRVVFKYRVSMEGMRLANRFAKRDLKAAVVRQMLGNPIAVAVAERDLSIEHIYEDTAGRHLLSFTINKQVLDGNLYPVGETRQNPFSVTTAKSSADQRVVETKRVVAEVQEDDAKSSPLRSGKDDTVDDDPNEGDNDTIKTDDSEMTRKNDGASVKQSDTRRSRDELLDRLETLMEQKHGEKPKLPEAFRPRRTRENPAGVRENPYIQ